MASNIDPTQPPASNPTTAAMRANMAAAKAEIEALQARLILESHIINGVFSSTNCPTPYAPSKALLASVALDTHGLADLANEVFVNPYFGIKDCFVDATINLLWAATPAPGAADYKACKLVAANTLDLVGAIQLSTITHPSKASSVYGENLSHHFFTQLSSAYQYLAIQFEQASAGALSAGGSFKIDIYG